MTKTKSLKHLEEIINSETKPLEITSDKGLLFRLEFKDYCTRNQIDHRLPAAYNPKHKGRAEFFVQIMKNIIKKKRDYYWTYNNWWGQSMLDNQQ